MQRCRAIGKRLDEFRRIRTMYTAFENGLKTLESNSVDADKLIDDVSNAVLEARAVASSDEVFTHVGVNDNGSGLKVVRKILKGEDGVYIKTGFKTFDSRNRGFSRSSARYYFGYNRWWQKYTSAANIPQHGVAGCSRLYRFTGNVGRRSNY